MKTFQLAFVVLAAVCSVTVAQEGNVNVRRFVKAC